MSMEKKHKIIIGVLVAVIVIFSCIIAFQFIVHSNPDEVITLESISFNITNNSNSTTNFKVVDEGTGWKRYFDNSSFARNVIIIHFGEMDTSAANSIILNTNNNQLKEPSQTVNGVVVYTTSATKGQGFGQPMYRAYAVNEDLKMMVTIGSNNPNETAKMILSLKFDDK